jgi:hypothetical protein
MSSETLLLAVIGGVFCGASLIGGLTIFYLWWQSTQRSRRLETSLDYLPPANPVRATLPPPAMPAYRYEASVPSPIPQAPPVMPPAPAGVRPGSTWIDGIGGMISGQRIMIMKEETLLGRSGVCDVQFHDPKVSRQHAMLRLYNNAYYIQDMQSTGGTYVNGQRIASQPLNDHDQVRIGDSVFVFRRQ